MVDTPAKAFAAKTPAMTAASANTTVTRRRDLRAEALPQVIVTSLELE
jgi:hypothetical protein